ncbi:MAG: hypothetical protein ACREV9_09100 [Burkholderiales bacterium]
MLNRSNLVRVAITFAAVTIAAPAFADDSSWLGEQRSISDGYSPNDTSAGAEGKQGSQAPAPQLDEKLFVSDGGSPATEAAASVYVGATLETSHDGFVQRGLRITDGATE